MKKALIRCLGLLGFVAVGLAAQAETFTCPDLAQARQIASCPAEVEMRYLFDNKCNDDHYASPALCVDYAAYRAAKNVAMWESQDGEFTGNRSCDPGILKGQAQTPAKIVIDQRGTMTTLRCEYRGGVVFSLRTRKVCRVEGNGQCADGVPCRASCD